jgi:beta-glucosidase
MWFEEKGGFTKFENAHYYLRLVRLCVRYFGDLVSEYITINEPNVYAVNSWLFGEWPPAEKSLGKTIDVMSVMTYCHIKAYELIHRMRKKMGYNDTKVSFANHLRCFVPKDATDPMQRIMAKGSEWAFQKAMTVAMCTGRFQFPMKNYGKLPKGEYCDFQALNYYSRSAVSNAGNGFLDNVPVNDLDWEMYPHGIVECAQFLYDVLPRPIYVTENGTCDNQDTFRCRYLYEHLKELCDSGLPVQRYYHWCFCDNFEWLEGESARFGLVHVDYETRSVQSKRVDSFTVL